MKIRTHRPYLINSLIQKYREQSNSVEPTNYSRRILNCSTNETIKQGAEQLNKDNFKIVSGAVQKM